MCYGHPHHHLCSHQSVKWHYCPRAKIDVTTGHATICDKTTYAISQPSKAACPLKNCHFKELGGVWDCCQCKQGPNTLGWCTFPKWPGYQDWVETCDHGCCKHCTRSESAGPMPIDDSKKKTSKNSGSSSGGASSSAAGGDVYGNYYEQQS
ncbi:hypothetical protein CMQ_7495 [Grosmannia clavigera kw1407]|uniref:Uncharacterized protein n=1 Tax=Grosmannia clavigera (strain kw1407 / UAMH 11150) TaxID=655863 RepID=F0XP36_GROCL|nr:uncharacterized protein CMQ_7495 [Grosmannia clavigera kw1407]EFX00493.1 hypothetical protein CMQ_7495 [Grosmannia clavigera kw1407]